MNRYEVIRYLTVHMQGFRRTGNNVLKVTATGFFAFLNINGVGTDIILTAKHFAKEISRVVFRLHYIVSSSPLKNVSEKSTAEVYMLQY